MRTLFVGDVHGCSVELKELLVCTRPTRVILLGDIFTKGPYPRKVWKLIQKYKMEAVLGNHDVRTIRSNQAMVPEAALYWLRHLPLFIQGPSWIAVHGGINPSGPTLKDEAIFMRRYPMETRKSPFWWEGYQGEKLVIYGHDAKRKIQDHRPNTLGLDSGCVYGFSLTGYLLEEDRLYEIPAQESYCPI